MLLRQGYFLLGGSFQLCDVRIAGSTITEIESKLEPSRNEIVVSLDGLYVIPGLINSHDHLEFNLFPNLGHPPYQNYVEWADDIQQSCKDVITEVLKVSLKDRLLWGAYKNILSGVTTVVHHNKFYRHFRFRYPLEVYKNYRWVHSLRLEKRDIRKLVSSNSSACFIHLAEGIDAIARAELKELMELGGLTKDTIIVHGVGLSKEDIETMKNAGAGIVWCPASNSFLFSATAPVEKMFNVIPIALGTDSTLTGSLTLFEEMRLARHLKNLSASFVLELVTTAPARMLGIHKGIIKRGALADLLFFDKRDTDPFESILKLSPLEVKCLVKNGRPIFGDVCFSNLMPSISKRVTKIQMNGLQKFIIGDFENLIKRINHVSPSIEVATSASLYH
jgi:cytosine/adenosine deaminase-related metal-dependent hydrolase